MDRTIAPAAAEIDRPNLPTFDRVHLNQDLDVIILNQGKQDVVLLELIYPIGRFEEPAPGLAFYLFKMLSEGTSKHTSEEIASAFDYYGSHLDITPTLDHVSIKLYSLTKFFPKVLELLCELLTDSTFPENEFDILKQIRVQQIKQQEAKNNLFASLKFRELLFGSEHPYGRRVTTEQAEAIKIEDLHSFKAASLTKPLLFLTGKITDAELDILQTCFGQFKFNEDFQSQPFELQPAGSTRISKEGSNQASIRMGMISIDRKHPEIHLLKITNEILGGFFGSRLMKNIREDKGLTYGIHSSMLHLQHASYWTLSSEILIDKVDLALSEIQKELDILSNQMPSDQELAMVTNYMKGKFLSSFDSPFSSHNMIKNLALDNLSIDYFYQFFDALQEITPQDISNTAKKYLNPDALTTLVVS